MIIKNGLVFNAEGRFEEKEVYVEDEKISKTGEGEIIDATGLYVIPGLTDIHFHACVGYDFCDGTKEAISKMAEYELKNGITTICPASMTFSEEKLSEIYKTARDYDGKEVEIQKYFTIKALINCIQSTKKLLLLEPARGFM